MMSFAPFFRTLAIAILLLGAQPLFAQEWELVWSDEFDGPDIDAAKWTHEVNARGGGNNELQFYTARPENSFIRDGKLVIKAIKETFTAFDPSRGFEQTREFTSARMVTKNKGDWKFGRIEARLKVPGDQGLWPAFWMMPTDSVYGGWAASGEIDIMEHRGDIPERLFGTIHYGGQWPDNTHTGVEIDLPIDLTEDFHTYAIEWDEGLIRWFFDGELYATQTDWFTTNGDFPAPFDQRFHVILNCAVGGNFLPDPPPDADFFPKEYEIDYVRVFKRTGERVQQPWPDPETPAPLPGRVEAENYDQGGPAGLAYDDADFRNRGFFEEGVDFRSGEMVDVQIATDDGGGHNIGWMEPGEWLEYTVAPNSAGRFRVRARAASADGGGSLTVKFLQGAAEIAALTASVPDTGGWQTWTTVDVGEVELQAGPQVMRVEMDSGAYNLNFFDVELLQTAQPKFEFDFEDGALPPQFRLEGEFAAPAPTMLAGDHAMSVEEIGSAKALSVVGASEIPAGNAPDDSRLDLVWSINGGQEVDLAERGFETLEVRARKLPPGVGNSIPDMHFDEATMPPGIDAFKGFGDPFTFDGSDGGLSLTSDGGGASGQPGDRALHWVDAAPKGSAFTFFGVVALDYSGTGLNAGAQDVSEKAEIVLDARLGPTSGAFGSWQLKLEEPSTVDGQETEVPFGTALTELWQTVRLPLDAFVSVDPTQITKVVVVGDPAAIAAASDPIPIDIMIDNVRFEPQGGPASSISFAGIRLESASGQSQTFEIALSETFEDFALRLSDMVSGSPVVSSAVRNIVLTTRGPDAQATPATFVSNFQLDRIALVGAQAGVLRWTGY